VAGKSKRIGIKDVAAAAGVSPTTVSHALSGKGRVTPATRERIVRIAGELGYRPNASAVNLASGRTGLIGITVSTHPDAPMGLGDFDYFIQLLSAATGGAVENGLTLVADGSPDPDAPFTRVEIDGAIVVDPVVDDRILPVLEARGIPIVTTGRRDDETEPAAPRYWVDNDHRGAALMVLDHLAEAGAQRVGLVTTPPLTSYSRDALAGYLAWCEARGQEPAIARTQGLINESAGFAAASELLDRPDRPDAIWATLDQLALGVLHAARTRSLRVPEELLVAGYTESRASVNADPPLTAVALNAEELGRAAVGMLSDLIAGREPAECPVVVPTQLVVRKSTTRKPARAAGRKPVA
jgi:DNA-binding LacI/PurR family transcriptional regulator